MLSARASPLHAEGFTLLRFPTPPVGSFQIHIHFVIFPPATTIALVSLLSARIISNCCSSPHASDLRRHTFFLCADCFCHLRR